MKKQEEGIHEMTWEMHEEWDPGEEIYSKQEVRPRRWRASIHCMIYIYISRAGQ